MNLHPTGQRRRLPGLLAQAFFLGLYAIAAPAGAAVMISQVYGGGGNSGAVYTHDFVELHNSGASAVSIAGWTLQYSSATGSSWANQKLTLSGAIPAGGYYLIQLNGGANGVALPAADATGSFNMSASNGKLALVNSSTALAAVTCPLGNTSIVDFVGFGTSANCAEPSTGAAATPAPSNSTAIRRVATATSCQDSDTNANDFVVVAPAPRNASVSARACDVPADGGGGVGGGSATDAFIYAIQGSGATSPLIGSVVRTSGVVTRVNSNGFFIQDVAGDGNPATSDGIFVFAAPAGLPDVAVGNVVQVTGTVVEFASGGSTLTELSNVSAVTLLGSGSVPAPVAVSLPVAVGDSLERYEGMLVSISGPLTVQQNYFLARYGQLTVGVGGRHETPTNRYRPGSASALAMADLQARSRLLLDDGSSLQNLNPMPYLGGSGKPRAGDSIAALTGTLDFGPATSNGAGPGLYRLHPTVAPVVVASNPRPATPPAVGGNVRLASMNVLNFFTTFTDGNTASGQSAQGCSLGGAVSANNCRGADNLSEFMRQRGKIVLALAAMNADAVGLMEIQNNGSTAVQNLVDALNATVGAGTYAAVPDPAQGMGDDAIKVAMIYKPSRLARLGASVSDTDAINNRPTLAQTFAAANGEKFTLVVNHLKSKGSCPPSGADADLGDGQGCWNATRVLQAQRLRSFVAQLQSSSGSNDVLLVGDFNAYGQEDPIYDLTSSGYVDQMGRYSPLAYSYIFDGTSGRLDHGISTATMSSKITGAMHWHIDADETLAQDYNLEFKQPACASCAVDPYDGSVPFRASDHDPAVLGLNLYKIINGTAAADTLNGTAGDDMITGGPGSDRIAGGAGSDLFVYRSVTDGADTISDFQPGIDRIVLTDLLRSLGLSGLPNPIASGHVACVAGRGGALIGMDTDGSAGTLRSRALLLLSGQSCATVMNPQNFVF